MWFLMNQLLVLERLPKKKLSIGAKILSINLFLFFFSFFVDKIEAFVRKQSWFYRFKGRI